MSVKLPIQLKTFENWSGRCQATVKAQMPPLLRPQMAREAASCLSFTVFPTSGRNFFDEEVGVLIGKGVVLERAVAFAVGKRSWCDEDADRFGHLSLGDEIIEHDGDVVLHPLAILENHDIGGFIGA